MSLMTEHKIRHIPIVNDTNELIGLVSQRDVLAAEQSSVELIDPDLRRQREAEVSLAGLDILQSAVAAGAEATNAKQDLPRC